METQTADLSCRGGPYPMKCFSSYLMQKAGLAIIVLLIRALCWQSPVSSSPSIENCCSLDGRQFCTVSQRQKGVWGWKEKRPHWKLREEREGAESWRKEENMKNKTRESAIVRENLFSCFPGCNQCEQDIAFTLCMLPHTVHQVRMAGLPLQGPRQQLHQYQKEINLLNSRPVHRLFSLFWRGWWRVRIGRIWRIWRKCYFKETEVSLKHEKSAADPILTEIALQPSRNIPEELYRDLLSGDAVDHFYRLAG